MEQQEWIGLADAVRALRSELTGAITQAEGERLQFNLESVEMEFLLEVRREAAAEAGIKFWVVNAGVKGGMSRGSTHRVTLALTPKDLRTGSSPQISDEE